MNRRLHGASRARGWHDCHAPRKRRIERSRVRHGPCEWAQRPLHGEGSVGGGVWQRSGGAWESAACRVQRGWKGLKRRSETQGSTAVGSA